MVQMISDEMNFPGVSVIIARRPCIQKIARDKREKAKDNALA